MRRRGLRQGRARRARRRDRARLGDHPQPPLRQSCPRPRRRDVAAPGRGEARRRRCADRHRDQAQARPQRPLAPPDVRGADPRRAPRRRDRDLGRARDGRPAAVAPGRVRQRARGDLLGARGFDRVHRPRDDGAADGAQPRRRRARGRRLRRRPARARELAAGAAATPGEAAEGADFVLLSLPAPEIVERVAAQLPTDVFLVDMSTGPPALARRLAERFDRRSTRRSAAARAAPSRRR